MLGKQKKNKSYVVDDLLSMKLGSSWKTIGRQKKKRVALEYDSKCLHNNEENVLEVVMYDVQG